MRIDGLQKIIAQEKLQEFHFLKSRNEIVKPDEIVLYKEKDEWVVGAASERASLIQDSFVRFRTGEEACDNLLKRLRADKQYLESRKKHFGS